MAHVFQAKNAVRRREIAPGVHLSTSYFRAPFPPLDWLDQSGDKQPPMVILEGIIRFRLAWIRKGAREGCIDSEHELARLNAGMDPIINRVRDMACA